MQLARHVSAAPGEGAGHVTRPEDGALLDALPIAAAILRMEGAKLWLEAYNGRYAEALTGDPDGKLDAATMKALAKGDAGQFISAFLTDPEGAPDELKKEVGEGLTARYFEMKVAPLKKGGAGQPRCLLSLVDRTLEKQAERNLRAEMLRDSLTGLPNRLAFTETVEAQNKAPDKGVGQAVLVIDVRRFSRINESMGSLAGDELLITLARRLMSALRGGDVLARVGGNEFGILVGLRRGADDALAAAARIQELLSTPFRLSELEIRVDCAIGIALMDGEQDGEELFRNAQFAVKQAKQAGKPQVYEPSEASAARRRFSIETELRRALDRDELELHYQPLVDLKTGQVSGFEALARWTHEDRGKISPIEFIPVAEESGLILDLGNWALHQAAQTLADWDKEMGETLPISIGVNLSAIQVARDNIADMVGSALKASGIKGDRLTLELTESAIVQDPARATRVFEALKNLETTVAMDDFGTGYSSLAYLQRLPIDVLKIDKSFVTGMLRDQDSIAIVRAVLSLADALGMKTTAEGIESIELATTLAMLGCDKGQGFYFAKPLPTGDALSYFKSRRDSRGLAR